jgi:NAD(P)-dependent dehydrogenase (short-subunit alcohol dehydrogenase family)
MPIAGWFEGRQVVVTGGTGGLGSAVVGAMLEAGAEVHIPCFAEAELRRFALREHPRVHVTLGTDLGDEGSVVSYYEQVPEPWASIHLVGGFEMAPLESTSAELLRRMWSLNALTCFLCVREAARRMAASGGRIVNVAARPALEPTPGMIAYAAAKAAVAGITQSAAAELRGRGVWVNAVVPSVMDTPANRAAMPGADCARWPKVEEVAAAIGFLASPANALTTGALVPVYGKA